MKEVLATEEELEQVRANLGTTIPVIQTNEAATKDVIRHFADGIGDPNPLWRDETYAAQSPLGCIVAPPTFLNAIAPAQCHVSLPKLLAFVAGFEWEWQKPIRVNDTFSVTNTFEEMIVKRSSPAGRRLFLQLGRMRYQNQKDELVGVCRWSNMRSEFTPVGKSQNDFKKIPERYLCTPKELDVIEQAYRDEEIRGSKPRYWEDVEIGEEIRPVVKGPLIHADMVAFFMGINWMYKAHGLSPFREDPEMGWKDTDSGITQLRTDVHFLNCVAWGKNGIPFAYDMGLQRLCWLGHMMTNWMGDDGFLKNLSVQIRAINYHGDTTWCRGRVVDKTIEDGKPLVKCEVWCENQKGEITAPGTATVVLPSKK